MSSLPSARWIVAAAMCVFLALTLVAHAFAEISDRDAGEGRLQNEIRDVLSTDDAREDFEQIEGEDEPFRIPGTDIELDFDDPTDLSYDEFVERTSERLSETLYEGGPDQADEILEDLSLDRPGDGPLNFFAEPEENDNILDTILGNDEAEPLAFFESDEQPLEGEFRRIFEEVGDDEGLASLDAHEAIIRLRLTFGVITLIAAGALAFLVQGGAARLLAPASVAWATSLPFAAIALLLYAVLRPDDDVSLGSIFNLLDISIGDILRDYMIFFGLTNLALIAGLVWSVVSAQRPRRFFERAFPARGVPPATPDENETPRRTH